MNKTLSLKLTIISFFLMLIVVTAHAKNIEFDPDGGNVVWGIQTFVLNYISNIVIPTFFFISGYLFFLSMNVTDSFSWAPFKQKIIKRFTTLGIPYLIWTSVFFVVVYVLQILPGFEDFFKTPLSSMSFGKQLWNAFWEPVNYPLWYIRELIIMAVISPILFLLIKYLKLSVLVLFFICALYTTGLLVIFEVSILKFFMLMSFCFGGYMALNKKSLQSNLSTLPQFLLVFTWLALIVVLMYIMTYYTIPKWQYKLYSNLSAITGCLAIWTLYDYIDKRIPFTNREFYHYSFFLYVTHGIPILLLKSFFTGAFELSKSQLMILYVASFAFITISCIFTGMMFKRFLPKTYEFVMGSRT